MRTVSLFTAMKAGNTISCNRLFDLCDFGYSYL